MDNRITSLWKAIAKVQFTHEGTAFPPKTARSFCNSSTQSGQNENSENPAPGE
jgi:hypothetical protein